MEGLVAATHRLTIERDGVGHGAVCTWKRDMRAQQEHTDNSTEELNTTR